MRTRQMMVACVFASALAGCNTSPDLPLVFYQATTVGISASATGGGATPELSLGYRDTDVAVVPVSSSSGSVRAINPDSAGHKFQDALSVFGQFQVDANAGTSPKVGLGKFFATGQAAQHLADGFRDWQRQGLKPEAPPKAGE
jgi:hypothetical protein